MKGEQFMRTKKKFLSLVCLVIALMMVLTACGGGTTAQKTDDKTSETTTATTTTNETMEEEKTTLQFMAVGTDADKVLTDNLNKIIDKYQKDNPNVTVELSLMETEQYKTKLTTVMAANSAPDIFMTWEAGWLKPFVTAEKVYDLTDDLNSDTEWKGRYLDGVLGPLTFDNKVYAIPTMQTCVPLFYNKEIFAKYGLSEPKTFDDLKNAIKILNDNKITPFGFGCKSAWIAGQFLQAISNQVAGMDLYNNISTDKTTWEDPAFIESGKVLSELAKLNAFPKGFLGVDYDPALDLFVQGNAGMLVMGSWAIGAVTDEKSPIKDKVGVAKFPSIPGGKGSSDVWVASVDRSYGISTDCKNPKAAVALLKLTSDPTFQKMLAEEGKSLLPTKTQLDESKLNPILVDVMNLQKDMKGMAPWYDRVFGAGTGGEFNNAAQRILAGKSVEESFKNLEAYAKTNDAK